MQIIVEIKSVYGNELIYPLCETGKNLCNLAKTKTFTRQDIDIIKKLGFTFQVAQNKTI